MAEYRVPTQQELDRLLYMQGMQGKSNQQIIDENLARGSTIQSLPDNFFQTASAGARRVGDYVNQAGNVQQIVNKLFPSNIGNTQANVQIPKSFNFAPKQAPTGEILPAGLQTQSVPVANILQAIKPADVLGISGTERAYGDIGAGKAPQPMDVVDTLGVGAMGLGATGGLLKATKGLPVGMSIQEAKGLLQVAPKSDIGFYSAVEQAAMASPRKSATGQAFLNDIMKGQDVRADEIKWMGLDDYLKGKQNVTKQEVQDYIANNRVDVKEVQLGDTKFNKLSDEELINEYIRIRGYDPVSDGEALTRNEILYELEGINRTESGSTKFGKYTLPGGENYRELLLTMPNTKQGNLGKATASSDGDVWNVKFDNGETTTFSVDKANDVNEAIDYAQQKLGTSYRSSHFPEQQNPLAHIRVNDRIDSEGKKMLLIEEVQSDWHQAGREQGYIPSDTQKVKNDIQKRLNDIDAEKKPLYERQELLKNAFNKESYVDEIKEIQTKLNSLQSEYAPLVNQLSTGLSGVPDAPFKDTWYQLALKRAIQHAAENGYDRIGLTTGKRQIDRYSNELRQNVDEIRFGTLPDESLTTYINGRKGGESTFYGNVRDGKFRDGAFKGKTLEEVLGKQMARQIVEKKTGKLEGNDLSIGGEGMKKYYDETYPKFLEKYGKKWGAKVGETKVNTVMEKAENSMVPKMGQEGVRYIDITPEMKAGVSKGQPLFAAVPAIPAAGLLAPQEKRR
jgi:hypothetical protein